MFSFGGSKNKSKSSSNMDQSVWGPQGDAFTQMYGNLNNFMGNMMPYMNMGMGMVPQMQNFMWNPANRGMRAASTMTHGGSAGNTNKLRDSLYSSLMRSVDSPSAVGRMYEDIVGGSGNTYVDPLIDSMRTGAEERRLTRHAGNALDAADAGQGGWSRHAMQNAMADRMIDQDLNLAENELRAGAYDKDLNWKMDIARMADTNRGATQDRMLQAMQSGDQNRMAGLNYLPMVQNMGMGTMAPWMQAMSHPFNMMSMYSNMFGDPTVLTSGSSSGKGSGGGFGFGIG